MSRANVSNIRGNAFRKSEAEEPINERTSQYFSERGIDLGYLERDVRLHVERGGDNRFYIDYYLPDGSPLIVERRDGSSVQFSVFREWNPKRSGRNKGQKFTQPKGVYSALYFAPIPARFRRSLVSIAQDARSPLIITEGPVKAMAIAQHGGAAIAVNGCWNWKTSVGAPVPEWDSISLSGRDVTIVYDSDAADNTDVQDGLLGLRDMLAKRGATVFICLLSPVNGDPKTGADDWIAEHGYSQFVAYLSEHRCPGDDPKFLDWGRRAKLEEMNRQHAVVMAGSQAVVLTERDDEILLSTPAQLKPFYENRFVGCGQKRLLQWWLEHPERRTYSSIVFQPDGVPPEGAYNLWRGFKVQPKRGKCGLFLKHVREIIADGNRAVAKYVLAWMADAVQNPGTRPGTAIALRGEQGTGKGVFANTFGSLFGTPHFVHLRSARQLTGRFNSHLMQALVVFADEAFWAGDHSAVGPLKALITEDQLPIELKGKDIFFVRNFARLLIASNDDWIVPAGPWERRFCVLDVGNKHRQDVNYFRAIAEELNAGGREALLHYLLNFDLTDVNLRDIPKTEALWDQQLLSMTSVQKFWFERLMEGRLLARHKGWVPLTAKSELHARYAEDAGLDRQPARSAETEFGCQIKNLVPGLKTKRESSGHRRRQYLFPPLDACRQGFEKRMGRKIEWD